MDAHLKGETERILAECGLNATQGINLFYRQIVLRQAFRST
jgi:antitoxin component of RelBE/YafQ-DinJ toxin-antitoxin module